MNVRARAALTAALLPLVLGIVPSTASGAAGVETRTLPAERLVADGADSEGQLVDATQMVLKAAPHRGSRARGRVTIPAGLLLSQPFTFYLNTDADALPEAAYFAQASGAFLGRRMKSWTEVGDPLPGGCGRVRGAAGATTAAVAFDPLCLGRKVKRVSVSFNLVAGADSTSNQDEWLPGFQTFSQPLRAVVR